MYHSYTIYLMFFISFKRIISRGLNGYLDCFIYLIKVPSSGFIEKNLVQIVRVQSPCVWQTPYTIGGLEIYCKIVTTG